MMLSHRQHSKQFFRFKGSLIHSIERDDLIGWRLGVSWKSTLTPVIKKMLVLYGKLFQQFDGNQEESNKEKKEFGFLAG